MENPLESNLKNALVQLKVASQDIDLDQNDLVEQLDKLDSIKENITNAILFIKESLKKWESNLIEVRRTMTLEDENKAIKEMKEGLEKILADQAKKLLELLKENLDLKEKLKEFEESHEWRRVLN